MIIYCFNGVKGRMSVVIFSWVSCYGQRVVNSCITSNLGDKGYYCYLIYKLLLI